MIYTTRQSAPVRSEGVLLIWQSSEKTCPDHRCSCGKAQGADALTELHGDGDLLEAVCRQAFTVLVEAPEIMAAIRQEKRERERVPRVKSPSKLREPVGEMSMPVTTTTTVT